jgi:hypothetical protein
LAGAEFRLRMKAEALAIDDVAHLRADFAAGPEMKRFLDEQIADAIILLDEFADFPRGFRGGNIGFGLRRLREEAHAGNVLAEHGDDGEAERLINIGDEFVARHVFEPALLREFLFEGQVPVLVAGVASASVALPCSSGTDAGSAD